MLYRVGKGDDPNGRTLGHATVRKGVGSDCDIREEIDEEARRHEEHQVAGLG